MVLKELIFYHLLLWEFVVVLKELIFYICYLGVCGGHERTDFYHLLLWEFVVVMKELIFYHLLFGSLWWS